MADIHRELSQKGLPKLIVTDPEYTFSIVGLVASMCGQPLVGLILSAIALKQSKAANRQNTYALIGMIIGIVWSSVWVLFSLFYIVIFVFGFVLAASHH